MALTCVHETMTRDAMKELGFREEASNLAAAANKRVDDKQGNSAAETNLHAMRGIETEPAATASFSTAGLQSEDRARTAVKKIIENGRKDVVQAVLDGDYELALKRLGETLHTVQDRAFHNFEPWPYYGIGDAILRDPSYMICHSIRDLSVVSDIVVGPRQTEVELSRRVVGDLYVGVRLFHNARDSNPYLPSTTGGPEWNNSLQGTGALISLTFGAAPGSLPRPGSAPAQTAPSGDMFWQTTSRGVAMRTRAEDDSADFIKSVETAVGARPDGDHSWKAFLSWH